MNVSHETILISYGKNNTGFSTQVFISVERSYTDGMPAGAKNVTTDWTDCPIVEVKPKKVSGLPLLKGTRVQADTIVESAELGRTPDEIASDYRVKVSDVKALLAYAARHNPAPVR
jgi:uncharacterized protein (DUF433 family)